MRRIMANGRVSSKPVGLRPPETQESKAPLTGEQARPIILEHRAVSGMRVLGHLDLRGQTSLNFLPDNLTCETLNISDCVNLTVLPVGLHVTYWLEIAGSGLTSLPPGHGFVLHWRGVPVSDKIAFAAQSITGQEILDTENVELRRVLIERLGYEQFLQQVGGLIRDRDRDLGGERQLIYVPFEDDESLMLLKVMCPSTKHTHVLRVPPYMRSCHQAAAWIAGFDNPNDYHPWIET